ncbi:MAG: hypothetical protein FK734_08095 [Asgard group archaeon]|nr:hypothetical protein [Asgard group archaeon]
MVQSFKEQLARISKFFIGTFRLMHFLPVMTITTIAAVVSIITVKGDLSFSEFFAAIKLGTIQLLPVIFLVITVFCQEAFCGIQNDYLDREVDALYNKRKAIPDEWVGPRYAFWLTIIFFILFSGFAFAVGYWAKIGFWSVLYVQGANLLGIFYNLYAKNKPISILPYMVGFPLVPAYVWLTFGQFQTMYYWIIPILFLVSFPAHIANELPDYELDVQYQKKNFAVLLGKRTSTIVYWLGIGLIEALILTIYFVYNLNLWVMLAVVLLSLAVAVITIFLMWKKNWHTDNIVFDLVTACIGIEVIGFFVLII